jgi:nucleoside-diphosphate-sugar epimerase
MRIFLAGGTGVIGRRALRLLVESGHDVSVLTRSEAKADAVRAERATPVAASLFDRSSLVAAFAGHDTVINLTTHIPPLSKSARASAWKENDRIRTEGSANIVGAALEVGIDRYLQEALAFSYDDHGADWITEAEPLLDSPFTASVQDVEAAVERFTAAGRVGVALRFGQFYAPEATHTQSLLKGARRGWSLLPGPGDAYTVTIAAEDAASAVVAALAAPAGVYNIVDSEPLTRDEWAAAMAQAVGRDHLRTLPGFVTRVAAKKGPTLVSSQRVSNRRFVEATGWQPRYPSFREGIVTLTAAPGATAQVAS